MRLRVGRRKFVALPSYLTNVVARAKAEEAEVREARQALSVASCLRATTLNGFLPKRKLTTLEPYK